MVANFILPDILVIAGIILLAAPPAKINSIYGFRTKTSGANEETWAYCNRLCAMIMIAIGIISIAAICTTIKVTAELFGVLSVGEFVNVIAIAAILLSIPVINCCCRKKFPNAF